MKKRSIVIVLVVALLFVFAMAGSALAYDQKLPPSINDQACSMTWPGPDEYTGDYYWHLEWSLDAGRSHFYRIEHYSMHDGTTTLSPYYRFTEQQIKAGKADVGPFYYSMTEGEGDIWRVQIISIFKPGFFDWTYPGWQS